MACAPSYLEIVRVLQSRLRDRTTGDDSSSSSSTNLRKVLEIAAEEFGIPRDEYRYVYNSKRRKPTSLREEGVGSSERDLVVGKEQQQSCPESCRHSCCEHDEVMDPNRWEALPHDLLQLVFAHLPVHAILRLRSLSQTWKETILTARDCDFFRVCEAAHPKMFAFIRKLGDYNGPGNSFLVQVFDSKFNTWHSLQISLGNPEASFKHLKPRWRGMSSDDGGSDGGLALFYLEAHTPKKKTSFRNFFYTVVNPLTQRSVNLPPILDVGDVPLQHMTVDRVTNRYKVLIVVNRRAERDATVLATEDILVFDSQTGEWSQPNDTTDDMFGKQSAYDFAKGQLIEQYGSHQSPYHDDCVQSYTFLKNRLFVLVKDIDVPGGDDVVVVPAKRPVAMYYIREYAVEYHPQHPPTWLEVRIHRCGPFEKAPKGNDYHLTLRSSNGVLMVYAVINERKAYGNDRGWIYDLGTRTWCDLPKVPGRPLWIYTDVPCEIRWTAHP